MPRLLLTACLCVTVAACATGTLDERFRDGGGRGSSDTTSGRDTGARDTGRVPAVDTGRVPTTDTGPADVSDALTDVSDARSDVVADAMDATADGSGDVAGDARADAEPVDYSAYEWPAFSSNNPFIVRAVQFGREAMQAYCTCCGDGSATCPETALDGGFPADACAVEELEDLGSRADYFVLCLDDVFSNLKLQTTACTSECVSIEAWYHEATSTCASHADSAPALEALASCAAAP